jgi:hypothetical protein
VPVRLVVYTTSLEFSGFWFGGGGAWDFVWEEWGFIGLLRVWWGGESSFFFGVDCAHDRDCSGQRDRLGETGELEVFFSQVGSNGC